MVPLAISIKENSRSGGDNNIYSKYAMTHDFYSRQFQLEGQAMEEIISNDTDARKRTD